MSQVLFQQLVPLQVKCKDSMPPHGSSVKTSALLHYSVLSSQLIFLKHSVSLSIFLFTNLLDIPVHDRRD
uniref:Uncharacterized protein n=1 Tax=Castor canadensis TaxID=51338 RepID=A0A8C0XES8_CASCN